MSNIVKSPFLNALTDRGFIHQCSDLEALDAKLLEGPLPAYIGFDCTAPSLHAGSLVQIMMLRWLQQSGHKPIVLMGGGTTRVGDPSGRDESRQLLTDEKITENMDSLKQVFNQFLTFGDGPSDAVMVNNADWLDTLQYIPFLRDFGQHFSINRMLNFDSVKLRLEREQPLSFLEFNYMILQAYDFRELSKRHSCRLQMGGSDQWGNIINGIDLTRRVDGTQLFALTTPLLTTSSGAKMGKTASGAVWLKGELLSPYDYWQYWRNSEDADIGRFLRLFTELPLDEIDRLQALEGNEINDAKKVLASKATAMLHGAEAARAAEQTAVQTFEAGTLAADLPRAMIARDELEAGFGLLLALNRVGFAASNGEARRLVRGGGVRINDTATPDEARVLSADDLLDGNVIKVSAGKKRHALLALS